MTSRTTTRAANEWSQPKSEFAGDAGMESACTSPACDFAAGDHPGLMCDKQCVLLRDPCILCLT